MKYAAILLTSASLISSVFAISFTQVPVSVTAGVTTTLKWSGADASSPVTITLKKGESHHLETVAVLTDSATGGSYNWTPSKSLPNADNYALFISQGTETNYSGEFSLAGGSTAPLVTSLTTSVSVSTVAANATTVYLASTTGTGITIPRNTTFSSQTLSATGGGFSAGVPTTTAAETTAATTSGPSATPTKNAAIRAGSPLAFVLSAFAAILFWA